jgi:hypothetical protein
VLRAVLTLNIQGLVHDHTEHAAAHVLPLRHVHLENALQGLSRGLVVLVLLQLQARKVGIRNLAHTHKHPRVCILLLSIFAPHPFIRPPKHESERQIDKSY